MDKGLGSKFLKLHFQIKNSKLKNDLKVETEYLTENFVMIDILRKSLVIEKLFLDACCIQVYEKQFLVFIQKKRLIGDESQIDRRDVMKHH